MSTLASLPFTTSHAEWLGLIVSAISLIGIGGIVSSLVCHKSGCLRRGRFKYGHYRLCHIHHPLVPNDGKITADHIASLKPDGQAEPHAAAHRGPSRAGPGKPAA